MKSELIIRRRVAFEDGAVAEMVVWRVPEPAAPTTHGVQYRLAYVENGRRMLGRDNERGKGDHRHIEDREERFEFCSPEDLLERFIAEIETMRGAA